MNDPGTERTRDRERTTQKLLDAALAIIRERGFAELGVNAVAERAGVSKVLIYRYFGDLAGLYGALAEVVDPLQARAAERMLADIGPDTAPQTLVERTIMDMHRALADDELTKQLLIWELNHRNALTDAFSEARERTGLAMTEAFEKRLRESSDLGDVDVNALLALVTAGVFYLTLRSDSVREFNGVDITSEEGWRRIARTLSRLLPAE